MWRHYVYIHRRADDNRVFYVGKGTLKADGRTQTHERAYDKFSRNDYWRRVFNKHGLIVEIVASFIDDEASQQFERELIAYYGRKNLVNMTDGGDGCAGLTPSDKTRAKLSELAKRPRTKSWIESMRAARKNGGNGGVVKHGDKLPESWKQNIAKAKTGVQNPMHGKTGAAHPMSRKVRDVETGAVYDSVLAAAEARGYKMKTLYNWLSGHRNNPTALEFA